MKIEGLTDDSNKIDKESFFILDPDKNKQFNQIIIGSAQDLDINLSSVQARELLSDTIYTFIVN
jgi:hypothetical protein